MFNFGGDMFNFGGDMFNFGGDMFNFGGVQPGKILAFVCVEMFMVSSPQRLGLDFFVSSGLKKNSKLLWYMMGLAKTLW